MSKALRSIYFDRDLLISLQNDAKEQNQSVNQYVNAVLRASVGIETPKQRVFRQLKTIEAYTDTLTKERKKSEKDRLNADVKLVIENIKKEVKLI